MSSYWAILIVSTWGPQCGDAISTFFEFRSAVSRNIVSSTSISTLTEPLLLEKECIICIMHYIYPYCFQTQDILLYCQRPICTTKLRNFAFSVNYMFDITKYRYANRHMRAVNDVGDYAFAFILEYICYNINIRFN